MSQLLDHPVPTLPPPPPRKSRGPKRPQLTRNTVRIAALVVGVLTVGAIWLFYFSSVFALESLVVEGVRTIPPSEVGQRADLGAGTPLARINPDDVEARVMTIPAVKGVEVVRRWPNIVVIRVFERQRSGYVKTTVQEPATAEGATDESGAPVDPAVDPATGQPATKETTKYEILDSTGYAFESFATLEEVPEGLPEIKAPDEMSRTAAAEVGGSLPPKLLKKIVSIKADTPDNVILTTEDQVTVMWGKSDQNELKARILEALLKRTDDYWIDLRFPQAPTTAYTTPQPAPPPATPTPSASGSDSAGDAIAGGETAAAEVSGQAVPDESTSANPEVSPSASTSASP